MFRTILTQAKKPLNWSVFTAEFCTKPVAPVRRREINDVRILGTLINDSYTLQSGTKALTIRTRDSPERYSTHNIHINTIGDFQAGQRVYALGKLRSSSVPSAEGRKLTQSIVKAHQVYVVENENGSISSTEGDKNDVELIVNVASDVQSTDRSDFFSVATHFPIKNEQGEETTGVNFHRVFAYNDSVRQYIKENLKKSDRIVMHGRIGHQTHTEPDGKKLYSGFIIAESIVKIARRGHAETVSNETESVEAKAEN